MLEAARIRGATAYVAMVADLAGDSALASYYYPLFQSYRLFGINSKESALLEELENNTVYGL